MPKGISEKIKGKPEQEEQEMSREPDDILLELYRSYGSNLDQHLWPLETARWHELVFCLATSIAGPDLSPEVIREVVRLFCQKNLIAVDVLGRKIKDEHSRVDSNPILITIITLLEHSGFTNDEARKAVISFCEAARGFVDRYQGKVQLLFRKYGSMMMEELTRDFTFTEINKENASMAFANWLQNTLNIPLPMSNPTVDAACKKIGVQYPTLVEVADSLDINVAILDDILRAYWADQLALGEESSELSE